MAEEKWDGKTRGGLAGYKIFVWVLKTFGINISYCLLFFVSMYFVPFAPKASIAIYRFYRKSVKFNPIKALFYVWKNYFSLGQVLIDKVAVSCGMGHKYTLIKPNHDQFLEMLKRGTSIVLVTAHNGNFEAAGHFLDYIDRPVHLIMYQAELEQIKNFLSEVKTEQNFTPVVMDDKGSHIFKIAEIIKDKGLFCLHGDRYVPKSKTLSADFFGEKVPFTYGPFYITSRFDTDAAFVSLVKTGWKEYTLVFEEMDTSGKPQDVLNQYSSILEDTVKKYPHSWFNYFDFWKKNDNNVN
ncbi:MAG: hypothetical protein ACPG4Z_07980 [Chitinophagales bacterium]